jgi:hypothetical protein
MWVVAIDQAAASCGVRLWMWKKAVRQNNYGFLKIYEPTPRVIHSTSHSTLFLSHWLVDPLVSTFFFLRRVDRQEELAVLCWTWLLEWAHDSIFMLPVAGNPHSNTKTSGTCRQYLLLPRAHRSTGGACGFMLHMTTRMGTWLHFYVARCREHPHSNTKTSGTCRSTFPDASHSQNDLTYSIFDLRANKTRNNWTALSC